MFKEMSNKVLVSSDEVKKLSPEAAWGFFEEINKLNKPVVMVPSIERISNPFLLVRSIPIIPDYVELQAELSGIPVSSEVLSAITTINNFRKSVQDFVNTLKPEHKFQNNFVFRKDLSNRYCLSATRITLRNEYSTSHQISLMIAKELWEFASNYWTKGVEEKSEYLQKYESKASRKASITQETIQIGCKKISRNDVESIAVELGWVHYDK
jgi:hypothetical protein